MATGTVTREELKGKMDRGEDSTLVDVLDEGYYRRSHLPGAVNLPLEELGRVGEVLPDRDAEIVVYCMSPM